MYVIREVKYYNSWQSDSLLKIIKVIFQEKNVNTKGSRVTIRYDDKYFSAKQNAWAIKSRYWSPNFGYFQS